MTRRVPTLLAAALLAAACATPQNADLDRAHRRYAEVERNPLIDKDSSADLYEARKALDRGDDLLQSGASQVEVSHQARLAELRLELAELLADTRATRADAEKLLARRQELQLEARTTEADRAALRAQRAEAEAAAASAAAREAELQKQELQQQLRDLEARQTERGMLLTLGGVLFEFGKADLKPEAKRRLDRVAGFLVANTNRQVAIEGHTDNVGSDEVNLELSKARAQSVRDYLAVAGVAGLRMASDGYGKRFPVASNDTADGRAQNRRVEIVILDPGVSAVEALRR